MEENGKKKVLLVDDERTSAEIIKRGLEHLTDDYSVDIELDSGKVLDLLAKKKYNLLLTDLNMPVMNGIELLKEVRKFDPRLPVVIITVQDDVASAVEAINAGASDYVLKQVSFNVLDLVIKRAIEKVVLEDKVQESEIRFRSVIDNAAAGIVVSTIENGEIVKMAMNPSFCRMLGYEKEEIEKMDFRAFTYEEDVEKSSRDLKKLLDGKVDSYRIQKRYVHKKGNIIWSDVIASSIKNLAGEIKYVSSQIFDITEQKRNEEDLKLLAVALDQVDEIIMITDIRGNVIYLNTAVERITGYTREEIDFFEKSFFDHLREKGGVAAGIFEAIEKRAKWNGRFEKKRKDGKTIEFEASLTPISSRGEEIDSLVFVARDITRAQYIEEKMRQAERMNALTTLTGGIAHDFNNTLWMITGNAELALDRQKKGESAEKYLNKIMKASKRAAHLVEQLRIFSMPNSAKKQQLDINVLLKEICKRYSGKIPPHITLQYWGNESLENIVADPEHFQSIMECLLDNSVWAIGEKKGSINVALKKITIDKMLDDRTVVNPGTYIELSVEDTGRGMGKDVVERAFDPFFSTKTVLKGSGMGLSVVHGIVKGYGGTVGIYSEPKKGTTVRILLPSGKEYSIPQEETRCGKEGEDGSCGRSVLCLDDDPAVCRLFYDMLSGLGFTVVGFSDAKKALERFREEPRQFQLIITDQTMPGMNGLDFIKEIEKMRKDIPVILCSGFSPSGEWEKMVGMKFKHVRKPVIKNELLQTLASSLGKEAVKTGKSS